MAHHLHFCDIIWFGLGCMLLPYFISGNPIQADDTFSPWWLLNALLTAVHWLFQHSQAPLTNPNHTVNRRCQIGGPGAACRPQCGLLWPMTP